MASEAAGFSVRSVGFDTMALSPMPSQDPASVLAWRTREGDDVSLHFFPLPPDIPPAATVGELTAAMTRPGSHVELAVVPAVGMRVLRLMSKAPQQPSGFTYIGAIIVAFEPLSYVIKVQCPERGMTGMREAVLLNGLLATGFRPTAGPDGQLDLGPGWNPDSPEHDAQFPGHPVSRARRVLDHVQATLDLDPALDALTPFPLP